MPRCRKSIPLFFLALLVIAQSFFPPMGSPADSPLLSWSLIDDTDVAGGRFARRPSSGNDGHIVGVRNVELGHFSDENRGQPLFEFGRARPAKKHPAISLPSLHNPSPAQIIPGRSSLQAAMMTSVTPLVLLSEFLTMTTLADKIVYLLFVLCYSLCIFSWLTRQHPDI